MSPKPPSIWRWAVKWVKLQFCPYNIFNIIYMFPFFLWVKTKMASSAENVTALPACVPIWWSPFVSCTFIAEFTSLWFHVIRTSNMSHLLLLLSGLVSNFFPKVLQMLRRCHPMSGKAPWTWASLYSIVSHLLARVQSNFIFFLPRQCVLLPHWGVLTPVSAQDLLWQLSFLHLSSFPDKVNPDSHSGMYYCCHVLSP